MSQLDDIVTALSGVLPVVEGVVSALAPEAAGAAVVAVKIAQGVAAAVPEAEALWAQFQSGTIPTQAELDAYAADEDGAYAKLMADIAAKQAEGGA